MKSYAIIFDMDGVIADTNPFHAKAFELFFSNHSIAYDSLDYNMHINGKHNSYILSHFFNRTIHGDELMQLEEEKEGLFREIYTNQVKAIDGLENFVDQLYQSGFRTAVGTSAPKANMDLILDSLDLRRYMSSLLCGDDVENYKPHPEIYLRSAENLKVSPTNCLVFEDSVSGVTAARNAGMKVVGVLSTHQREELPPCDVYIQNYKDIHIDLLKEIMQ